MILCCGEALIDMIPTPTTTGRDGFVPHVGGAVFNTAIALGRLGCKVGMLTGLSTDMFGLQLDAALATSHVNCSHVIRSDRPTTLAFVVLRDGHAKYTFYDENTAGRMLYPEDLPALADEVGAMYFGGISLACEPGADTYAALLEREGEGRAVMVDPNIRPGFIRDEDRFRDRLGRVLSKASIVKVSDEDLHWIYPEAPEPRAAIERIFEQGASVVIMTRGSKGATGYLASGSEVTVPSCPVEVVDTVGAGDTFNAGLLARLSELDVLTPEALGSLSKADLSSALALGAKVASVTVSRAGANPPWRIELDEALAPPL